METFIEHFCLLFVIAQDQHIYTVQEFNFY